MDSSTCIELALEGERLCKIGDFTGSVAFFEAAVKCGTNDMKTLSAIYSQLGNAYFYLSDYHKAMDYHKLDLTVAKSIGDRIGEAKASGNLGNTLKMMSRFDEAIAFCKRHLDISQELSDKVGEGRALYNLGNVYHTKGKSMARVGNQDPGEFPQEVKTCLEMAVDYYKQNLDLMIQLGDKSAQGRACGNLGNTHYLLGNFTQAVAFHEERLRIAREFSDKAAERRAQCNLGNAHIFLGEFEAAVDNYKETLSLAELLKDRVVEAQACYSLGNTYTLLRDYKSAIEYHLRHLKIAQELRDRIGEGRAYWSLGNALTAIGDHHEALNYAQKHLEISKEIGDITGQTTAQMSISDLRKLLETDLNCGLNETQKDKFVRPKRLSMDRMELVNVTPQQRKHSLPTVDEVSVNSAIDSTNQRDEQTAATSRQVISKSHEDFLDLVSKFQSKRMDDQRCALDSIENKENRKPERIGSQRITTNNLNQGFGNPSLNTNANNNNSNRNNNNAIRNHIANAGSSSSQESQNSDHFHDDLFDLIAGMQERRMNDQRATLPPIRQNSATNGPESLPGQRNRVNTYVQPNRNLNNDINEINDLPRMRPINNLNRRIAPSRQMSLGANVLPDDDFFEMLMRCQASRLEDQRSLMPATSSSERSSSLSTLERPQSVVSTQSNSPTVAPTVPDEDFFSLILRFQAGRIEDQRSELPDRCPSDDEPMKGSSASSRKSSTTSNKSSSHEPSARKSSKTQN